MHASFKFIAMLVLVTTFTPAFSTPIECVLILFTIAVRLIYRSTRDYCPDFGCSDGLPWLELSHFPPE